MGIVIDIILIVIVALSTYAGYRKGLVELATKLFAGIIAIIVALIIYKPISNMIIQNTQIDENIGNMIIEKTTGAINNSSEISDNEYVQNATNNLTSQIKNEVLPKEAREISISIIYAVTALVTFILIKLILMIIVSILNVVADLPILKQFNKAGGIIYGIIRGGIIACVCIVLLGVFITLNPNNKLNKDIQDTYITKNIYNNIFKK